MDVGAIMDARRHVEVPFLGVTYRIAYRLAAFTDELERQIKDLDEVRKGFDHGLLQALTWWDLREGSQELPICAPTLARLPMPFKKTMWFLIQEDIRLIQRGAVEQSSAPSAESRMIVSVLQRQLKQEREQSGALREHLAGGVRLLAAGYELLDGHEGPVEEWRTKVAAYVEAVNPAEEGE